MYTYIHYIHRIHWLNCQPPSPQHSPGTLITGVPFNISPRGGQERGLLRTFKHPNHKFLLGPSLLGLCPLSHSPSNLDFKSLFWAYFAKQQALTFVPIHSRDSPFSRGPTCQHPTPESLEQRRRTCAASRLRGRRRSCGRRAAKPGPPSWTLSTSLCSASDASIR